MPTLAQLGVEIDPSGAKAGGAQAEDALNRIAAAADKMAAAVDRFTEVAQQSGTQGAAAMQKVEKAVDETTTSLKESGAAAQAAGQQTAGAANTSAAAEKQATEAVQKRTAAHKEAGLTAEQAAVLTTSSTTEATAAQNRLTETVEKSAQAQRAAGAVGFDAMEAIARSAQMQASMTLEAEAAAKALQATWTQVAENHWTQQTENGLVNIIDQSQALVTRTKEQADAEFALMQAVRSRESASTEANQAYAQQMQQSAAAIMATEEVEKNVAANRASAARQTAPAAAVAATAPGGDAAAQKAMADQAKQQAAAAKAAREETAKLQAGFGEVSGPAAFGQALQRNSNLLFTFASLMGPAESSVLRLANGFGMAAVAAEKMGNSTGDQSARVKEVAAANEMLAQKQAALTAAQQANTAAQAAAAATKAEFATVEAEVTAIVEAEAMADNALADAQFRAAAVAAEFAAVQQSATATAAEQAAAATADAAAQVELSAAQKTATAAQLESVAALRIGTDAYEEQVAAEAVAAAAASKLASAQKEVAVAQEAATAAAEAGGASILGIVGAILPFLAILGILAVTLGTVYAAWHIFSTSFAAGSQFVTLHARFSQFVGDAKAAHDELERLEELSARSGLGLEDLEKGEAHLISFGAGLKEASDEMQNFAAISVRSGKDAINALGTLYATARDQGNVTMRQIMQLRTVNVDLLPQLRAQTGLTGTQLQHMLSQGNISFDQLKAAVDATAKAMKSLDIRANTPEGVMDSIATHYEQLKTKFGEPISLALVPLLQTVDEKVKSFLPDASSAGNSVGNLITAMNGAIKNGELGSLIYEVITTGTAKGWSYVDKNWFEPAKAAISDVFSAAHFGAAFRATFDNLGSLVGLWFSEGGLKIYAYLMEFLYNFEDAIAKSGIWGTGDANAGIPEHSRTAEQIYGQGQGALLDQYKREVQQNNDDYSAIMRRAGVETGELTGAFGSAVKAIDIFASKAAGVPLPKPVATTATANTQDFTFGGIMRQALTTPADQQGYWTMLLKNPPEDMVKRFAEHNAMVMQREFASIFASDPLLSSLFSPTNKLPQVQPAANVQVPFRPGYTPPPAPNAPNSATGLPAATAPAATTIPVRRAVLVKSNGDVVSIGDVGNSQGDLPEGPGAINPVRGGLMPVVTGGKPGGGVYNPADNYAAISAAVDKNTDAVNRNTVQTGTATTATTDNTQSVRARITFYDKFEDQYHDHIAFGGDDARARAGTTAAVDPNLFPYGGTLNIPALAAMNGTGQFRAEDTGGAVVNRTASGGTAPVIDIYVDANNPDEGKAKMAELAAKYGEYVNVSYTGKNGQPATPTDNGHIGGMPIFNRNLDTGNANRTAADVLPHGTPVEGTAPGVNYGGISMDQDAVNAMVIAINNYNRALHDGIITQDEFNRRVDELRSKTIGNLTDPSGGRKMADGSFQSYQSQINQQGKNVGVGSSRQYDPQVTAHRLALDKMVQDQKRADDLMKTNDEGVTNSFIAGMQKAAMAYGTFDQQVAKMGTTVVNDLVGGIANAIGEIESGSKTASQAFREMAASMLQDLSKLLIEMALLLIIKQALGMAGSAATSAGYTNLGSGLTNMSSSIGTAGVHHTGGIAGQAGVTRQVDLSIFNGASRYHDGGILPGEVPAILQPGEGVFTPEQMANMAPAGSTSSNSQQSNAFSTNITINSNGSSNSSTTGTGANDARDVGKQMDALVKSTLVNETRRGGILDQWAGARGRG